MSVEDQIERVMDFTSIGLTSLDILFFPIDQIAEVSETDLGPVSTASKILSGAGVLSIMGTLGMLYHRNVEIPLIIKWLLVPLILIHVAGLLMLFGLLGFGKEGIKKLVKFGLKFVMPISYSVVGVGMIPLMIIFPEKLFNVTNIGRVIYYIPAGLGIPPVNKQPFYPIVILVRAGGLITSLAGQVIELASSDPAKSQDQSSEDDQSLKLA